MIIEKVSGQSYNGFLKGNILDPLGMTNSGYDRATDILKERASGYQVKDGHLANADFIDMSVPCAAGDIYSTVEDMYRWNEALAQNGKLLSAESLNQMFTQYPEATHLGQHYGYGVVISRQKFKSCCTITGEEWRDFRAASNATQPSESALSYCQT